VSRTAKPSSPVRHLVGGVALLMMAVIAFAALWLGDRHFTTHLHDPFTPAQALALVCWSVAPFGVCGFFVGWGLNHLSRYAWLTKPSRRP
jgi:hypothetical protein